MEESTTYQAIIEKGVAKGMAAGIEKGRALEAREALLRRGRKHLGEPDSSAVSLLNSINDPARLEGLTDILLDGLVKSWTELLNAAQAGGLCD